MSSVCIRWLTHDARFRVSDGRESEKKSATVTFSHQFLFRWLYIWFLVVVVRWSHLMIIAAQFFFDCLFWMSCDCIVISRARAKCISYIFSSVRLRIFVPSALQFDLRIFNLWHGSLRFVFVVFDGCTEMIVIIWIMKIFILSENWVRSQPNGKR